VERFVAMGTRIELHQFGPGDPGALAAARRAVEAVDDALTIHRPSPTTAANDDLAAGRAAVVTDPVLLDALAGVAAAWTATGGLFDPTVGTGDGAGRWSAVRMDRAAGRIAAAEPVAFDFGGFGKGFALDRAAAALRGAGVASAFLSAGESSVAAIGAHPLGGAWPILVPHPLRPEASLIELDLLDEALSVSATVGAGARAPGRSPTVRPGDGSAVTAAATAIAVEPTGAAAEAMSTALLVADASQRERLLAERPGRRYWFEYDSDPDGSDTIRDMIHER
jgi:FAD:protein FMN transferase